MIPEQRTDYPAWSPDFDSPTSIDDDAQELLEKYSSIPPSKINAHVKAIAKRGFEIFPYPSIGLFWFLHLELAKSPAYSEILAGVKNRSVLVDLGCGFGQDIRRLVYDGAPADNIVGLELREEFIDLGFDLFKDRSTLQSAFLTQDFFVDSPELNGYAGRIRFINSSYFLHMFDWTQQITLAERMLALLHPAEGGIITGTHAGIDQAVLLEKLPGNHGGGTMFRHDMTSFARFWDEVKKRTGKQLSVETREEYGEKYKALHPQGRCLRWCIRVQGSNERGKKLLMA